VAKNFLDGIGLTNDAILYGTEVTLWVTGEASLVQELGPKIPSCASSDYGEPFRQIFERYDRDFYKIDPQLFSPAVVRLLHVPTGRSYRYGQFHPTVLQRSFE
jgi:methenyltetrahydromethanopterin cyclohydrolase